jgi:hypothetical protein
MVTPTTSTILPLLYAVIHAKGKAKSTASEATPWLTEFATSSPNVSLTGSLAKYITSFKAKATI